MLLLACGRFDDWKLLLLVPGDSLLEKFVDLVCRQAAAAGARVIRGFVRTICVEY